MGRAVCRKCWTGHGSGATVCPRCGAPIAAAGASTPVPSPPPPTFVPYQPGVTPVAPAAVAPPASAAPQRWRWLAFAVGTLVLGAVIALLLAFWRWN